MKEFENAINEIESFSEHAEKSILNMLDEMNGNDWEYDEKYNINVEMNGKAVSIPISAHIYKTFQSFLNEVKKDLSE